MPSGSPSGDPDGTKTEQGHYSGYGIEQFNNLLQTAEQLEGKFLLASFPSQILPDYAVKNGWYQIEFEMHKSAARTEGVRKIEVFTMNYQPTKEMLRAIGREE